MLLGFFGVWLIWDYIKLPFANPANAISFLPSIKYNPTNNIIRFLAAVVVPAFLCMAYELVDQRLKKAPEKNNFKTRTVIASILIITTLITLIGMGVTQASLPSDSASSGYSKLDTFHEGESLGPATFYAMDNEKPYSDYAIVHGVFQDPLRTNIAFELFGHSIGASRAFASMLAILTFLVLGVFLYVLFNKDIYKTALATAVFGLLTQPSLTIPFIGSSIIGVTLPTRDMITLLFFIVFLLLFRELPRGRTHIIALYSFILGIILTANFANSFDRAFYIILIATILGAILLVGKHRNILLKKGLIPTVAGVLLGIVILGLALKWDFAGFITYVTYVSKYKEYLDGTVFDRQPFGANVVFFLLSALILIGLTVVVRSYRKLKDYKSKLSQKLGQTFILSASAFEKYMPEFMLAVSSLVFIRSAIGRADLGHYAYSVIWLYILLIYVAIRYWSSLVKFRTAFIVATVFLSLSVSIYYTGAVKRINISHTVFPIAAQDSQLVPQDYQQAAGYIKNNLRPDQTFLTLTSEGIWYYLVGHKSPLQYPIIWYAFTQEQRERVASQLSVNSDIKYIVVNDNWTTNFDYVPNEARYPELYKVFLEKYTFKIAFGSQQIWERTQ